MDRRTAKEYLHIRDWLKLAQQIVDQGEDAYLSDPLLQEAGDSIMMKIGEAAVDSPSKMQFPLKACDGQKRLRTGTGSRPRTCDGLSGRSTPAPADPWPAEALRRSSVSSRPYLTHIVATTTRNRPSPGGQFSAGVDNMWTKPRPQGVPASSWLSGSPVTPTPPSGRVTGLEVARE